VRAVGDRAARLFQPGGERRLTRREARRDGGHVDPGATHRIARDGTSDGYTHTAAHEGTSGYSDDGVTALAASWRTLPGVSCPLERRQVEQRDRKQDPLPLGVRLDRALAEGGRALLDRDPVDVGQAADGSHADPAYRPKVRPNGIARGRAARRRFGACHPARRLAEEPAEHARRPPEPARRSPSCSPAARRRQRRRDAAAGARPAVQRPRRRAVAAPAYNVRDRSGSAT
jgi:hypothetical protein